MCVRVCTYSRVHTDFRENIGRAQSATPGYKKIYVLISRSCMCTYALFLLLFLASSRVCARTFILLFLLFSVIAPFRTASRSAERARDDAGPTPLALLVGMFAGARARIIRHGREKLRDRYRCCTPAREHFSPLFPRALYSFFRYWKSSRGYSRAYQRI